MPKSRLTKKQKGFADDILEGKEKRQAAKDNYKLGSKGGDVSKQNQTADMIAFETYNKPNVQEYLENNAYDASTRVVELSILAKNENVKLNANKDILDRAGYKPVERSFTQALNVNISDRNLGNEDLEAIREEYEEKLRNKLINEKRDN